MSGRKQHKEQSPQARPDARLRLLTPASSLIAAFAGRRRSSTLRFGPRRVRRRVVSASCVAPCARTATDALWRAPGILPGRPSRGKGGKWPTSPSMASPTSKCKRPFVGSATPRLSSVVAQTLRIDFRLAARRLCIALTLMMRAFFGWVILPRSAETRTSRSAKLLTRFFFCPQSAILHREGRLGSGQDAWFGREQFRSSTR
jgi:hypothetical protein